MAKVKVRLTHFSNAPGAEGVPGETVSVDETMAEGWAAKGGCVILKDEEPAKAEKPAKAAAEKPAKAAKE